jgi:hypothetical protein
VCAIDETRVPALGIIMGIIPQQLGPTGTGIQCGHKYHNNPVKPRCNAASLCSWFSKGIQRVVLGWFYRVRYVKPNIALIKATINEYCNSIWPIVILEMGSGFYEF